MPSAQRSISIVGRFIPGYPANIVILRASSALLLALLLLALLLLALVAAPLSAAEGPHPDRFELREGVVVERGADRLFLMAPDGALEALDLSTGEPDWRSTEAALPLVLGRSGLLAMAESTAPGRELELVTLDPSSGDVRSQGRFELPAPVSARIDDALGLRFHLRAASPSEPGSDGADTLLAWQYSQERVSGMPLPEQAGSEGLSLAGRLSVAVPSSGTPAPGKGVLEISALPGAGKAEARPDIELRGDQRLEVSGGEKARQFLSVDGEHVLVSIRIELPESAEPGQLMMERYRWTLYERSGVRLGSASSPVSYAPFFVAGGRVVHEVRPMGWVEGEKRIENGLRLRSVDLGSGVEMWTRDLRDTTYRGPFPP